ncbi:hypothetical protein [Zoogloea sp. LCSB751]|uniref:hypothetical protein n=1 Tax=Zoogloea sp. LCSB751 TaxID=1965277 RepID=UPI0011168881|nr:hypothetical protein [Zoogloea sp. LCSB751]
MKNPRYERFRILMRQYHRNHPWRLTNGLFIPHAYPEPDKVNLWDDVGFILNGRRVMVWWIHPKARYEDEIARRAYEEAGPMPEDSAPWSEETRCKRVGRSRKRAVTYRTQGWSDQMKAYFERVDAIEERLRQEGIDYEARPSLVVRWYRWGIGMELCAPLEVRGVEGVRALAQFAKRLMRYKQIALKGLRVDAGVELTPHFRTGQVINPHCQATILQFEPHSDCASKLSPHLPSA